MEDSTKRFSDRVEDYVKYRPQYPKEIIKLFSEKINFNSIWIVADIGAGTGISTAMFLENGNKVIAVEPNDEMRKAAEERLKIKYPDYVSLNGTSVETGIESNTINLIIVCQAFHWFDAEKTKIEFKRILKNDGFTAIIWNERRYNEDPFMREYENLLIKYADDYKNKESKNIDPDSLKKFFGTDSVHFNNLYNCQALDLAGLKGRMLSSSYIPKQGEKNIKILNEAELIFEKYKKNEQVNFEYNTRVYYSRIY